MISSKFQCKAQRNILGKVIASFALLLGFWSVTLVAQESQQLQWNGEWIVDGTFFKIGVEAKDGMLIVTPIESMGFEWASSNGKIEGNTATVEVAYAGVTGIIAVELLDNNTARAWALKCEPEFMVVCALAKDRQAVFLRAE